MKHILVATVILSILLSALQARAQSPHYQLRDVLRATSPSALMDPNTGGRIPRTINVNCATGGIIRQALQWAKPGDIIQITGTCKETVLITEDGITIEGPSGGQATIDGGGSAEPIITIDGATRVSIRRLVVQNGGSQGILARRSAAVLLADIIAQDNANAGIMLDESATGVLTNCTAQRNGLTIDRDGIRLFRGSSATLNGTIVSRDNGRYGLLMTTGSSLSAPGARITTERNGNGGITVSGTSSFVTDTANSLTAQDNTGWGIEVSAGSALRVRDGTVTIQRNTLGGVQALWESFFQLQFPSGATPAVQINENTGPGISITQHSTARINGTNATLEIHDNTGRGIDVEGGYLNINNVTVRNNGGDGLRAFRNASIVASNISVTGNAGNGLKVDEASAQVNNISTTFPIIGNMTPDINASFGARLRLNGTLNGSTIGTVACDDTVLRIENGTLVACP